MKKYDTKVTPVSSVETPMMPLDNEPENTVKLRIVAAPGAELAVRGDGSFSEHIDAHFDHSAGKRFMQPLMLECNVPASHADIDVDILEDRAVWLLTLAYLKGAGGIELISHIAAGEKNIMTDSVNCARLTRKMIASLEKVAAYFDKPNGNGSPTEIDFERMVLGGLFDEEQ